MRQYREIYEILVQLNCLQDDILHFLILMLGLNDAIHLYVLEMGLCNVEDRLLRI